MRVCILFSLTTIAVFFPSISMFAQEPDKKSVAQKPNEHFFEANILGLSNIVHVENLELGEVIDGQRQLVTVVLKNHSPKVINLESVNVSCTCTEAKVPKEALQPGQMQVATFSFPIEDVRGTREKNMSATIICSGGLQRIAISFRTTVVNVARFAISPATFTLSDDLGLTSKSIDSGPTAGRFEIPLLVDDPTILPKLKLESTDDLPIVLEQIVQSGDRLVARVKIDSGLVSPDGAFGELTLVSPYGRDKIPCSILREGLIVMRPQTLTFVREPAQSNKYVANAIVKVRSERLTDKQIEKAALKAVSLVRKPMDSLEGLEVSFLQMTKGIYRLQVEFEKPEEAAVSLPTDLPLMFTTDLDSFPIDAKAFWSN